MLENLLRYPQARWVSYAAGAGLVLGALWVALFGSQSVPRGSISMSEPLSFEELPFESLMQVLIDSSTWGAGIAAAEVVDAEEAEEASESVLLSDRPGVFRHLDLVAILREPKLTAVMQPVKMPESMRALMLSSRTDAGLYQFALEEEIAEGWAVSGIADTYLEIKGPQTSEIVEYRLFDWP